MSRHDAAGAAFWEQRYRDGVTPWDAGGPPAALADFLAREPRGRKALLPGCGTGYEVQSFAAAGHDARAIDFSPAAVARARATLGQDAHRVALADFFTDDCGAPFDLIYERAFLCALPPALWPLYAARVAALLAPGGRLVGFFFGEFAPQTDLVHGAAPRTFADRRGPPFPLLAGELEALLAPGFTRVEDCAVADSIPVFKNRERWQVWQRQAR